MKSWKRFYFFLFALWGLSWSFSATAQTLEDIREKTGFQPRTHKPIGKPSRGDFRIVEVNVSRGKNPIIKWISPDADEITLTAFFLMEKRTSPEATLVRSSKTFRTSQGTHECYARFREFHFQRFGRITRYHVEIRQGNTLLAKKYYPVHEKMNDQKEMAWHLAKSFESVPLFSAGNDLVIKYTL